MSSFYAKCPAKINLFLKVTSKRDDGYYALESLFAFLDLYDQLEVFQSKQFNLEINGEFGHLLDKNNNIFTKILTFFVKNYQISPNITIKITKNIPVAAGLGGGSSNAAYFIHALNKIFALNLNNKQLLQISLNFGSDIAFLLGKTAAIVQGRGEIINNYPNFRPITALLINPKVTLATSNIFANFDDQFSAKSSLNSLINSDINQLMANFGNDLEKVAIKKLPLIAQIINNCKNNGAKIARMSGSGASCFAIFDNLDDLDRAKKYFEQNHSQYFVKKLKIIDETK